jgi:hypothetical protein
MQRPGERPVAASGAPHAAAAGTAPADDPAGSPPPPPVVAAQPPAPGPDRVLDQKDPKIDDRAGAPAAVTAQPALSGAPTRPHGDRAGAPRSAPHPAAPSDAPSDADADPDARDKLQQAEAALAGHDYDRAERLANGVINSSASARQRASARLVHGTVQCAARNDQEAAQIDLRALDGFRALRARLLTVCRRHGMLTEP